MRNNYFFVICLLVVHCLMAGGEVDIKKTNSEKKYDVVFFFKSLPQEIGDRIISFAVLPLNQQITYKQTFFGQCGNTPEKKQFVSARTSEIGVIVFASPQCMYKIKRETKAYPCVTKQLIESCCYKK